MIKVTNRVGHAPEVEGFPLFSVKHFRDIIGSSGLGRNPHRGEWWAKKFPRFCPNAFPHTQVGPARSSFLEVFFGWKPVRSKRPPLEGGSGTSGTPTVLSPAGSPSPSASAAVSDSVSVLPSPPPGFRGIHPHTATRNQGYVLPPSPHGPPNHSQAPSLPNLDPRTSPSQNGILECPGGYTPWGSNPLTSQSTQLSLLQGPWTPLPTVPPFLYLPSTP